MKHWQISRAAELVSDPPRSRHPPTREQQFRPLLVVQFGERSALLEQVVQTRMPLHQAPRTLGSRGRACRGFQVAQQGRIVEDLAEGIREPYLEDDRLGQSLKN